MDDQPHTPPPDPHDGEQHQPTDSSNAELASPAHGANAQEHPPNSVTGAPDNERLDDQQRQPAPTLAFSRPPEQPLTQPAQPRKNERTSTEAAVVLLRCIDEGQGVREAAITAGLNLRTAYRILKDAEDDVEALRAATRHVLAAEALDRVDDWRTAARVGALKKGNHGPARDWLLHAGVIDALDSDSASVRIAINIGTPEQPMRIPSPLQRKVDEE